MMLRDILLPVIISSIYWITFYNKLLFLNLFIFVIISIAYVYYCKWVNSNYESIFGKESIDEKLKDTNSFSRKLISAIWVSHFAFFFFGGISLGVSVPFMITREMFRELISMGYSKEELNNMSSEKAHKILTSS